jgi:hypothetical protein
LQVYPEQLEGHTSSCCKDLILLSFSRKPGDGGQAINIFPFLVLTPHPKNFIHHVLCIIKRMIVLLALGTVPSPAPQERAREVNA